ncbi:MAG: hypothetical protein WC992_08970 [Acholeplasmataceae bacterium]
MGQKYDDFVYRSLQAQSEEFDHTILTNQAIDEMPPVVVLDKYLEWKGIRGYTQDILHILGIR